MMMKDLLMITGEKFLDRILWDILRIRRPKYGHRPAGGNVNRCVPTMTTFRTYLLGGDPFNDRIEFFLKEGSHSGGFGDPVPDGEVRKITGDLTEDEIRVAFGITEKQ